ncbi:hypothetical protein L210DRAFT_3502662 [Boletus edulis BED1]|uniref:Uncharacterized protein n=1 Tax=Boletus edulis BED1 TaxID=1328754 RepID=A0AAD4C0C0_BOLED|nr:hypothetical protein L210DRAFT_3502662 [Boletus edulis BED1]
MNNDTKNPAPLGQPRQATTPRDCLPKRPGLQTESAEEFWDECIYGKDGESRVTTHPEPHTSANDIDTEIAYACSSVTVDFGCLTLRLLPVLLFQQDLEPPFAFPTNPVEESISPPCHHRTTAKYLPVEETIDEPTRPIYGISTIVPASTRGHQVTLVI